MKICTKCAETRPFNMFAKNGKRKDGTQMYRPECNVCREKYKKEYQSRPEVRERLRERWANDPEWRAKNRGWVLDNTDKVNEYARRSYRNNRDRYQARNREYGKKHYLENKEYYAKLRHDRRTRQQGLFWSSVPDSSLIIRDGLICGWCSRKLPEDLTGVHRDHIMPLVLGGPHVVWNVTMSCVGCNLSKGKKDPLEFSTLEGLRPSVFVLRYLDLLRLSRTHIFLK